MKRLTQKVFVLAVGIVGIAIMTGCEEQTKSDVDKHRLIAAENMQLKKNLERCQEETRKQKELLEQCKQAKKNILVNMLGSVSEDNKELREENENLITEITKLKEELEIHKGPTPLPHTE